MASRLEQYMTTPDGRIAYRKWLEDPMTKMVFEQMELQSRPKTAPADATPVGVAQSHGFVAGVWHALDAARSLDEALVATPQAEQPKAEYAKEGE